MRIGIDFDNTIVSYDALFHKVAREQDLVPAGTPENKLGVRDFLRGVGQEERWTELQGYVYGARMDEALAYEGVIEFIDRAIAAGHELCIVSHKTRHPFLGTQYDLHSAARSWVEKHLVKDGRALLPAEDIHFELSKQDKVARIAVRACDAFIDDLPEILLAADFPVGTARLLFDPEMHHVQAGDEGLRAFSSWRQLSEHFSA